MNTFDDYIYHFSDSLSDDNSVSPQDMLLAEALITTQKILNHATSIKVSITNKKFSQKIGKQLLLCAKLEMINDCLSELKRECTL